jgi:hypothetical protein
VQRTLGTALAGLVLGALALPVAMATFQPFGLFLFAAMAAFAALRRESRPFAGGLLIAFGLWWVHFIRQAVERCEALDRQPGGICAIYGTAEQLAVAGCVALVGALLVGLELRRRAATA